MPLYVAKYFHEFMDEAKEAEENNELEQAAKLYERAVKLQPHNEQPYNRLMIIYRKLQDYENELKLINKGIKEFEEFYQKRTNKILGRHQKAAQLSNALARSLGQKGKKENYSYYPEPIPKWIKRQQVVEKKLGR